SSGICHTDVFIGSAPSTAGYPMGNYPKVYGHEGSAIVKHIGSAVKSVKPGDSVLLSYTSCGSCGSCNASQNSYCGSFFDLNFGGHHTFVDADGKPVYGSFFGQSSFASYSVVRESSIVNVTSLVSNEEDLALFAPLGCGIQTGAGTVINAARPTKSDIVLVTGLGGVGLSAIMGAAISGARMIVGVDRVDSRLELAQDLGATHVINSNRLEGKTLVEAIQELCDGDGPHYIIETTGAPPIITASLDAVRRRGTVIQVGSAPPDFQLPIQPMTFMATGKTYRGAIEGEADPRDFVPKMIGWYREGRFPLDKLVKFMKAEDFQKGLKEMHDGTTIKPVLLWS
ncbi:NAD(P)-binding protein, partial [Myriangium duriaei CBS 260.36]